MKMLQWTIMNTLKWKKSRKSQQRNRGYTKQPKVNGRTDKNTVANKILKTQLMSSTAEWKTTEERISELEKRI